MVVTNLKIENVHINFKIKPYIDIFEVFAVGHVIFEIREQ